MKGHFKFFNRKKGFGFIIGKDGCEYFTSYSNIKNMDTIKQVKNTPRDRLDLMELQFETMHSEKGPIAYQINII